MHPAPVRGRVTVRAESRRESRRETRHSFGQTVCQSVFTNLVQVLYPTYEIKTVVNSTSYIAIGRHLKSATVVTKYLFFPFVAR